MKLIINYLSIACALLIKDVDSVFEGINVFLMMHQTVKVVKQSYRKWNVDIEIDCSTNLLTIWLCYDGVIYIRGWWEQHSLQHDVFENCSSTMTVNPQETSVNKDENFTVLYTINGNVSECVRLHMLSDPRNITIIPEPILVCPTANSDLLNYNLTIETVHEGIVILTVVSDEPEVICTEEAFVNVNVAKQKWINTVADIIGWIYTVAWDASFVPQIWHNYRRKSVVGLSFDFLTLNFIGFSSYGLFNIGLYWIPAIQDEYYVKNPTSILHVRLNDVIFPIYAVICTAIQILQCFIYERGNQRVSTICRCISAILLSIAVIYIILVGTVEHIWWIDFLYVLSYIKLTITCIKYFPQLYENYKRKSTEGWSIWQVILDFTGGSLSLLQMFLLAYNYDDFHSVLTDPSKLGLGLLSVFFNIFFFLQHYVIYRHKKIQPEELKKNQSVSTLSSSYGDGKEKIELY